MKMGLEEIKVRMLARVGTDLDGYSSPGVREIAVRYGLTGYLTFHTFVHELIHQIFVLHPFEEGESEERVVEILSHGLVDLLLGNSEEWCRLLTELQSKGMRNGIVRKK